MRQISVLGLMSVSLVACVVESAPPPLRSGEGIAISKGTASVDDSKVPVLPSCAVGQIVAKTSDGWECVTPVGGPGLPTCAEGQLLTKATEGWRCQAPTTSTLLPDCAEGQVLTKGAGGWACQTPSTGSMLPACADGQVLARVNGAWACQTPVAGSMISAGAGISLENNSISARFGTGANDVARGDHSHDAVYRKADEKLAWGDLDRGTIPNNELWPGQLLYGSLVGAPDLSAYQRKLATYASADASTQNLNDRNLKTISTFTFNNVPAGNVFATMQLAFRIDQNNTNQCGLAMSSNNTAFASAMTHGAPKGGDAWQQRSLAGTISNFPGGTLTIILQAWCDTSPAQIAFGTNNDIRFSRQLSVIAGL